MKYDAIYFSAKRFIITPFVLIAFGALFISWMNSENVNPFGTISEAFMVFIVAIVIFRRKIFDLIYAYPMEVYVDKNILEFNVYNRNKTKIIKKNIVDMQQLDSIEYRMDTSIYRSLIFRNQNSTKLTIGLFNYYSWDKEINENLLKLFDGICQIIKSENTNRIGQKIFVKSSFFNTKSGTIAIIAYFILYITSVLLHLILWYNSLSTPIVIIFGAVVGFSIFLVKSDGIRHEKYLADKIN